MNVPNAIPLLVLFLVGCSARIQHGLDERQANELQSVLTERGIAAQKVLEAGKKPTWAIEVDEDQSSDAIRILSELGLPRPKTEGFSEIFGKGSLIPSPGEERALFLEALSGEVARTLEAVEGVNSARVHLVLPAARSPGMAQTPAKASAFLRVRAGEMDRVAQARPELKALIAGSVEGLSPDGVTLVLSEVSSRVERSPSRPSRAHRLRALVILLGFLTSALGAALTAMTLRLRFYKAQLRVVRAVSPVSRSASSPVSRKAA